MIAQESLEEAIAAYNNCVPMAEIATWYEVSRQALWKRFQAAGIETRRGYATKRVVVCDCCGGSYEVTRSRFRRLGKNRFCDDLCRRIYSQGSDSVVNQYHRRVARMKVSEIFDLKPEHVVYYKDGDRFNTDLDNFVVFLDSSDYIRYRRGEDVVPVWGGLC